MSSVTSSTSTITSPFATARERIGPARLESNDRERGAAVATAAVGDGADASATVSLSETALNAVKAGALDVAGMAGDVVHAAEAGAQAVGDVADAVGMVAGRAASYAAVGAAAAIGRAFSAIA